MLCNSGGRCPYSIVEGIAREDLFEPDLLHLFDDHYPHPDRIPFFLLC
jgi:hypothetical protein